MRLALPIHIVNPGVDVARFPSGLTAAEARKRLGLDSAGPVLLSVARLVEWKGQDTVLRALPAIRQAFPGVHYVMAGDGPYRHDLQRLAETLGVAGATTFPGFVTDDDLPLYYAAADLTVLPAGVRPGLPAEGFGITLVEAAASGRPVVAGNVGGTADAVVDGVTGLLVDPYDAAAVADAVLRLLGDPELAARHGPGGSRPCRERVHLGRAGHPAARPPGGGGMICESDLTPHSPSLHGKGEKISPSRVGKGLGRGCPRFCRSRPSP